MIRVASLSVALIALALCACAHTVDRDIRHLAAADQCEAAQMLSQRHQGVPTTSRIKQAVGVPTSLILAGLGYTADATITFGGTGALSMLVCSPLVLLGAAAGDGEVGARCVVEMWAGLLERVESPGLGKGAVEKTRRWRCADTSQLTRRWRRVAQCYASRGDTQALVHAAEALDYVRERAHLTKCISDRERRLLAEQSQDLAMSLGPLRR